MVELVGEHERQSVAHRCDRPDRCTRLDIDDDGRVDTGVPADADLRDEGTIVHAYADVHRLSGEDERVGDADCARPAAAAGPLSAAQPAVVTTAAASMA